MQSRNICCETCSTIFKHILPLAPDNNLLQDVEGPSQTAHVCYVKFANTPSFLLIIDRMIGIALGTHAEKKQHDHELTLSV